MKILDEFKKFTGLELIVSFLVLTFFICSVSVETGMAVYEVTLAMFLLAVLLFSLARETEKLFTSLKKKVTSAVILHNSQNTGILDQTPIAYESGSDMDIS